MWYETKIKRFNFKFFLKILKISPEKLTHWKFVICCIHCKTFLCIFFQQKSTFFRQFFNIWEKIEKISSNISFFFKILTQNLWFALHCKTFDVVFGQFLSSLFSQGFFVFLDTILIVIVSRVRKRKKKERGGIGSNQYFLLSYKLS